MNTIKIEKEVTKEDVYVKVESVEDSLEIGAILGAAEEVVDESNPYNPQNTYLMFDGVDNDWFYNMVNLGYYKISIPQLAELLGVEYPLKPEQLPTLEELIAEAKSKLTTRTEEHPCWREGSVEVTLHTCGDEYHYSDKDAIAEYIADRIREEYL